MQMKCNCCWKVIASNEVFYVTKCSHLFCQEDANVAFSKKPICPACDLPISSNQDIRKIDVRDLDDKIMSLIGLNPEQSKVSCYSFYFLEET